MKMKEIEKEGKIEAIQQFRDKHLDELEKNLTTLKTVRDAPTDLRVLCPTCKKHIEVDLSTVGRDKNRIEATKSIARHLGALQPDKQVSATAAAGAVNTLDRELSVEEQKDIDKFLEKEVTEVLSEPM